MSRQRVTTTVLILPTASTGKPPINILNYNTRNHPTIPQNPQQQVM